MARPKSEPKPEAESVEVKPDMPLVLTVSEVAKLSEAEKAKFRHSGGTVIEDPN